MQKFRTQTGTTEEGLAVIAEEVSDESREALERVRDQAAIKRGWSSRVAEFLRPRIWRAATIGLVAGGLAGYAAARRLR